MSGVGLRGVGGRGQKALRDCQVRRAPPRGGAVNLVKGVHCNVVNILIYINVYHLPRESCGQPRDLVELVK